MDASDEVLALPYGDVDVVGGAAATTAATPTPWPAAAAQRPAARLGLPTTPAVAPPSGYLSPEALAASTRTRTILLTDRMLPRRRPPSPAVAGDACS